MYSIPNFYLIFFMCISEEAMLVILYYDFVYNKIYNSYGLLNNIRILFLLLNTRINRRNLINSLCQLCHTDTFLAYCQEMMLI